MFINLSNHPSASWNQEQITAAESLGGTIVDIPFPVVDPNANEDYISDLAEKKFNTILEMSAGHQIVVVHVMGEMTLTFAIVQRLLKNNILCVASTTERITLEMDGVKSSLFKFVKFRNYYMI